MDVNVFKSVVSGVWSGVLSVKVVSALATRDVSVNRLYDEDNVLTKRPCRETMQLVYLGLKTVPLICHRLTCSMLISYVDYYIHIIHLTVLTTHHEHIAVVIKQALKIEIVTDIWIIY